MEYVDGHTTDDSEIIFLIEAILEKLVLISKSC